MKDMELSEKQWNLVADHQELVNRLVKFMAKKLSVINNDVDDYKEAATWALINSAYNFDDTRNVKFSTYAITAIKREILNKYKKNVKLSKRFKEKDIASDNECSTLEPFSPIRGALDNMVQHEEVLQLNSILKTLPEKSKKIITMRVSEGKAFGQIGKELNITGETVRLKYNRILNKLNKRLTKV